MCLKILTIQAFPVLTACTQRATIRAWVRKDTPTSECSKKTWSTSKSWQPSHGRVCFRLSSDWYGRNMSACFGKEANAMLLCKKIKLEVSEQDAATLESLQAKCRG